MKYFSTYMYTKRWFASAERSKGLFYMVILDPYNMTKKGNLLPVKRRQQ